MRSEETTPRAGNKSRQKLLIREDTKWRNVPSEKRSSSVIKIKLSMPAQYVIKKGAVEENAARARSTPKRGLLGIEG